MKIIFNSTRLSRKITSPHTASLETKVKLNTSVETIEHEKAPTQLTTMGQAFLRALTGKENPLQEIPNDELNHGTEKPQDEKIFAAALRAARDILFAELPGKSGLTVLPPESYEGITGNTLEDTELEEFYRDYSELANGPFWRKYGINKTKIKDVNRSAENANREINIRLSIYDELITQVWKQLPEQRIKNFQQTDFPEDVAEDPQGHQLNEIRKTIDQQLQLIGVLEDSLSKPNLSREEYSLQAQGLENERDRLFELETSFKKLFEETERDALKVLEPLESDTDEAKVEKALIRRMVLQRNEEGIYFETQPNEIVAAIVNNLVISGALTPEREVSLEHDTITAALRTFYSNLSKEDSVYPIPSFQDAEALHYKLIENIAALRESDRKQLRLSPKLVAGLASEFYSTHAEEQITWGYSVEQHQEKKEQLETQVQKIETAISFLSEAKSNINDKEKLARSSIQELGLDRKVKEKLDSLNGQELIDQTIKLAREKQEYLKKRIEDHEIEIDKKSSPDSGWTTDKTSLKADGSKRIKQGKHSTSGAEGISFRIGEEVIAYGHPMYAGLSLGRELQAFGHQNDPDMISLVTRMEEFFTKHNISKEHIEPFKEVYLQNLEFYGRGLTTLKEGSEEDKSTIKEGGYLQIQASAQQILNYINPENPLVESIWSAVRIVTRENHSLEKLPEVIANLPTLSLERLNLEFKKITGLDLLSPGVFPLIFGENGLEARPVLPYFVQQQIIQEDTLSKVFIDLRPASITEAQPKEIKPRGNASVTTSPAIQHFFGKRASRIKIENTTKPEGSDANSKLSQSTILKAIFSSKPEGLPNTIKFCLKGLLDPFDINYGKRILFYDELLPTIVSIYNNQLPLVPNDAILVDSNFHFIGLDRTKLTSRHSSSVHFVETLLNILSESGDNSSSLLSSRFRKVDNAYQEIIDRHNLLKQLTKGEEINPNTYYDGFTAMMVKDPLTRFFLIVDMDRAHTKLQEVYRIKDDITDSFPDTHRSTYPDYFLDITDHALKPINKNSDQLIKQVQAKGLESLKPELKKYFTDKDSFLKLLDCSSHMVDFMFRAYRYQQRKEGKVSPKEAIKEIKESIKKAKTAQNIIQMKSYVEEGLKFAPDDLDLLCSLGWSQINCAAIEDSIITYKKVLEQSPDYPEAIKCLSIALSMTGKVDEAIKILDDHLINLPQSTSVLLHKADILIKAWRIDEALKVFEEIDQANNPSEIEIYKLENKKQALYKKIKLLIALDDLGQENNFLEEARQSLIKLKELDEEFAKNIYTKLLNESSLNKSDNVLSQEAALIKLLKAVLEIQETETITVEKPSKGGFGRAEQKKKKT